MCSSGRRMGRHGRPEPAEKKLAADGRALKRSGEKMKTGGPPCFLCGDLANPGADGTCGLCSGTGRQRGGGGRGRTKMGIDAVMRIRYTISVISEGVIGRNGQ